MEGRAVIRRIQELEVRGSDDGLGLRGTGGDMENCSLTQIDGSLLSEMSTGGSCLGIGHHPPLGFVSEYI